MTELCFILFHRQRHYTLFVCLYYITAYQLPTRLFSTYMQLVYNILRRLYLNS